MRRINCACFPAACLLAWSALGLAAPVDLDKVPPKVVEAVKAKYPQAAIVSVQTETEDDQPVFDFKLKVGDGKLGVYEAEFTPEGQFVEHKERLAGKELPVNFKVVVEKRFPNASVVLIHKKTRGQGTTAEIEYLNVDLELKNGEAEIAFDGAAQITGLDSVEKIAAADLPAAVKEALAQRYPAAKVVSAARETDGDADETDVVFVVMVDVAGEGRQLEYDPMAVLLLDKLTRRKGQ